MGDPFTAWQSPW